MVAHGHAARLGDLVVLGQGLEQLLYLGVHQRFGHLGLGQVDGVLGSYEVSVYFFMGFSFSFALLFRLLLDVQVFHAPPQLALALRQDHVGVVLEIRRASVLGQVAG